MSSKGKRVCLTMLWLCILVSMTIFIAAGKHWLFPVMLGVVAVGVTIYISKIKTADRRHCLPSGQESHSSAAEGSIHTPLGETSNF